MKEQQEGQITAKDLWMKELINHLEEWLDDNEDDANSDCPWTSYTYYRLQDALKGLSTQSHQSPKPDSVVIEKINKCIFAVESNVKRELIVPMLDELKSALGKSG